MLSNHLGNVLANIGDQKLSVKSGADSFIPYFVSSYSLPVPKPQILISKFQFPNSSPAPMTERTAVVTPTDVRYGFQGQEEEHEITGFGTHTSSEFWMLDTRIGRRWDIDPMYLKAPSWSYYATFVNNPILMLDWNGAWPWPIWTRSFISAEAVGGENFRGDGRGPSLSTDFMVASSRAYLHFVIDPQKGEILNPEVASDPTILYAPPLPGLGDYLPLLTDAADPKFTMTPVSTEKNTFGNNMNSFGFSYWAGDPLTPKWATPDLDVHADLVITENLQNGFLFINGTVSGDIFPSTEVFISDQSGKKLFLGAKKEEGGIKDLYGDNKKHLFTIDLTIKFDSKGNFEGVVEKGKLIPVGEWNKKVENNFNVTEGQK
jgi:hypothetical protein